MISKNFQIKEGVLSIKIKTLKSEKKCSATIHGHNVFSKFFDIKTILTTKEVYKMAMEEIKFIRQNGFDSNFCCEYDKNLEVTNYEMIPERYVYN